MTSPARTNCERRRAFTLLELVLVLTVLVIAAAVSWPVFQSWIASHRLQQGVDDVRTLCAMGRAQAMKEGRPYRLTWMAGSNHYRVGPDSPTRGAAEPGSGPKLGVDETLPDGVQFLNGPAATVLFWPDGTAKIVTADGTERPELDIVLGDRQGQARALHLRGLTGTTTVVRMRRP
jgi:prepilin-type N-terminal cleavage/methylation domain-containing protein